LNYARDQHRQKRGGNAVQVSLSTVSTFALDRPEELISLDEALNRLAAVDERKSQVVELKYFGGLENEEIAEVLKISSITVMRDWKFAKAWLFREIGDAA
jgi:RNA polymerase sigma-70 factor (ECF subfamily)